MEFMTYADRSIIHVPPDTYCIVYSLKNTSHRDDCDDDSFYIHSLFNRLGGKYHKSLSHNKKYYVVVYEYCTLNRMFIVPDFNTVPTFFGWVLTVPIAYVWNRTYLITVLQYLNVRRIAVHYCTLHTVQIQSLIVTTFKETNNNYVWHV